MHELSKTEMEIMQVLWRSGPSAVRDIVQAVYGEHTQSLHTTVKSLLERLMRKAFVQSHRNGHVHLFSALIVKEEFVQAQLDKLANTVYEGELAPVLLSMVERIQLTKKDRAVIESILEKLK